MYPDFAFPRSQSRLTLPLVHNIRYCLFYGFLSIVTLIFIPGIFVKNLYCLNPVLFKSSSLSSYVFFGIVTVNIICRIIINQHNYSLRFMRREGAGRRGTSRRHPLDADAIFLSNYSSYVSKVLTLCTATCFVPPKD